MAGKSLAYGGSLWNTGGWVLERKEEPKRFTTEGTESTEKERDGRTQEHTDKGGMRNPRAQPGMVVLREKQVPYSADSVRNDMFFCGGLGGVGVGFFG
jgi:hypothetical protein